MVHCLVIFVNIEQHKFDLQNIFESRISSQRGLRDAPCFCVPQQHGLPVKKQNMVLETHQAIWNLMSERRHN